VTRRGHTLFELMATVVVLVLVSGLCATLAASARDDDRIARGYVEDLRHVRDASDLVAARIRAAASVEATEDGVRIDGEPWTASDGALVRGGAVAVRGVSRLEVESVGPDTWRVGVAPVPRRQGVRAPALTCTVRRRPEAVR